MNYKVSVLGLITDNHDPAIEAAKPLEEWLTCPPRYLPHRKAISLCCLSKTSAIRASLHLLLKRFLFSSEAAEAEQKVMGILELALSKKSLQSPSLLSVTVSSPLLVDPNQVHAFKFQLRNKIPLIPPRLQSLSA